MMGPSREKEQIEDEREKTPGQKRCPWEGSREQGDSLTGQDLCCLLTGELREQERRQKQTVALWSEVREAVSVPFSQLSSGSRICQERGKRKIECLSAFLSGAGTSFLRLLENDLHIPQAAELFTGNLSTNSKRGALCIFESFTVHKRVEGGAGEWHSFCSQFKILCH